MKRKHSFELNLYFENGFFLYVLSLKVASVTWIIHEIVHICLWLIGLIYYLYRGPLHE